MTKIKTTGGILAATLILGVSAVLALSMLQQAQAFIDENSASMTERLRAPAVVSGDKIYIAWWTNNTANGNEEVMFRASTDGGGTFSNKTNLSNSTNANSTRVEIAGEGNNVIVTWWETNQTSDIPVARISTDAGQTFGPLLRLAANGTVANSTEERRGGGGGGQG
ncbi:MAG: hypothetical protein M3247_00580 [Thermoproteota archaeon]|nr:hypothetical protein [Thermoproteota archaeon]